MKRAKTTTKRERKAPKVPSVDQQKWDAIRADAALKGAIRFHLVNAARGVDQRAPNNPAWRTTHEVYDALDASGRLLTLAAYRGKADRIAALVTVLKDMASMGAVDSGRRVMESGPITGGEANVWKARIPPHGQMGPCIHVENGHVRRVDRAAEEALVERDVFADIYDVADGEVMYENVFVYASWTGNHRAPEAEGDWKAIKRWLRIVIGGGEG